MSKMVFNRYHQLLEFTCDRCGSKCTGKQYMKEYVIVQRPDVQWLPQRQWHLCFECESKLDRFLHSDPDGAWTEDEQKGKQRLASLYGKMAVIQMRKSIPLFKVYRKDILTGDVDVFDELDQRSVERRTGQPMAFLDHWEGGKAWERYKYIVIRIGGVTGTMKEKISCSLDGNIVNRIDDIIKSYPVISNRSAFIETACVTFLYLFDGWSAYDLTEQTTYNRETFKRDDFIRREYERRCELNAQKESEN